MTFVGDTEVLFSWIKVVELQCSGAFAITTALTGPPFVFQRLDLEFLPQSVYIELVSALHRAKPSLLPCENVFATVPSTFHNLLAFNANSYPSPMTQQVKGPALQADIDGSVTCIGHLPDE
jgi:hypothetical protein